MLNIITSLRNNQTIARIREAVARRFLVRIHRATHRMPPRLRTVKRGRVLVIAPHVDDEVIPCGGAVALHREAGSEVAVVFISDSGGPGSDREMRRQLSELRLKESEAVAELMGHQILKRLNFPDSKLVTCEPQIAEELARILQEWQPDQLFCPFPSDGHGDHQATVSGTVTALEQSRWQGEIWTYEVWSTMWPNTAVDITEVIEKKRDAIRLNKSQIGDLDYLAGIIGLNQYRGIQVRVEFAEAFFVCSPKVFCRLGKLLNEI